MKATSHILIAFFLLVTACGGSHDDLSDVRREIVAINEKCPAMLDSETRIDAVKLIGDTLIRYDYTLLNLNAGNLDTAGFRRAMWPGILAQIKVSSDMKGLRDRGMTIEYTYSDKLSKPVYRFVVRPSDYR